MGLTKINFNTCLHNDRMPVTIRFANQVTDEFVNCEQKMSERAAETVKSPAKHHVEAAASRITHMAEAGVPEHVIRSIAGHLTKRMMEHYTHIGMAAKRRALETVAEQRERELESPNPESVIQEKAH